MAKEIFSNGITSFEIVDGKFESFTNPPDAKTGWIGETVTRDSLGLWKGTTFDKRSTLKCEMRRLIENKPMEFMELHKALKNDPQCFSIAEEVRTESLSFLNG